MAQLFKKAQKGTLNALYQQVQLNHPLKQVLNFLVQGQQISHQSAQQIIMDLNAKQDALEYKVSKMMFEGSVSSGDAKVKATGFGDLVDVQLSAALKSQPRHVQNSFIVSCVSQCMNQGKELLQREMQAINDETLAQLYDTLDRDEEELNMVDNLQFQQREIIEKEQEAFESGKGYQEGYIGYYTRQRFGINKKSIEAIHKSFEPQENERHQEA